MPSAPAVKPHVMGYARWVAARPSTAGLPGSSPGYSTSLEICIQAPLKSTARWSLRGVLGRRLRSPDSGIVVPESRQGNAVVSDRGPLARPIANPARRAGRMPGACPSPSCPKKAGPARVVR